MTPCRSDPDLWTGDLRDDGEVELAEMICGTCVMLVSCRAYAAGHSWRDVTVAGWTAPRDRGKPPPWRYR